MYIKTSSKCFSAALKFKISEYIATLMYTLRPIINDLDSWSIELRKQLLYYNIYD